MQLPTTPQVYAGLRYAGVVAGTIVTGAATIGALDQDTAGQIIVAIHALADDLQKTIGDAWKLAVLLAPVVTVWIAKIGYSAASPKRQIAAVQALPDAQVVVTDPALAEGIPGVQVKLR
jgi:hypothetical protein